MIIKGRAHKFGDDLDTDVIIPARYLVTIDPKALAEHCMEGIDPEFPAKVKPGDIVVAGKNFGSGSSREHAVIALKGVGISLVIAGSFGRIFYRNAFNRGLPLLECASAVAESKAGDELEVELETGRIFNRRVGKAFQANPIPEFMMKLIQDGGLVEHLKKNAGAYRHTPSPNRRRK